MGLEMVAFVMDCEDEFGISIPDSSMDDINTVGEFFDLILPIIRHTGKPEIRNRNDLEAYAWDRVRAFCIRPRKPFDFITRFMEDLGFG